MATERWRPGQPDEENGAPPPLPALPLFPALPGYPGFDREVRELGFRHAADVLCPGAAAPGVFRVVDGLWLPGPGRWWLRADADRFRAAGETWQTSGEWRAARAEGLATRLAEVARRGPEALRRLVLYQLCCRLKDARAVDEAAALALGVHPDEARPLAAAVADGFPAPGPARQAAEELVDAWPGDRLRHAAHLARQLPAGPVDPLRADPFLAGVRAEIRGAAEAVERRLAEARRLRERGDHRAAATACLAVARQATDEPRARAGLLEAACMAAGAAREVTAARDRGMGAVRLSWSAASADGVRYQVLRFPDGSPEEATEIAAGPGTTARDTEPPVATLLRYAVIPWRDGRMAGIAKAAAPVVLLPDPERFHAVPVPDGVRVTWRAHPAARRARAVRVREGVAGPEVSCEREALTDRPLPAGHHHYRVSCGYPGPGGATLWSSGRLVIARAVVWPTPVGTLQARRLPGDGRAELSWPAPERGESRLLLWPGGPPPRPGEDVSALLADPTFGQDPHADDAWHRVAIPLPSRAVTRLTAVSVLGDRAVAGPTVVLEAPGTAEGLSVRRLGPARAEVTFRWPEPALLALLTWRHGDGSGVSRREERRLARSRHGGGRVEIPVDRRDYLITLTPVTRPDAALADSGTAQAMLPAMPLPRAVAFRAWQSIQPVPGRAARVARAAWSLVAARRRAWFSGP